MALNKDTITFGKYKGKTTRDILRDRNYCRWFLSEDNMKIKYEYLYNRIKEYNPETYFIKPEFNVNDNHEEDTKKGVDKEIVDFMDDYKYFNLIEPENVEVGLLSENDMTCYEYYIKMIDNLKDRIYRRMENEEENPYNIKAPVRWLQCFETETKLSKATFKEFMHAHDLPNIPYIIKRIKAEGGIEYKGADSYNIAKARSVEQETWWETILKDSYGECVTPQFQYKKCIFDFLNIDSKTIFECKLGLKDFNEQQHKKYKIALSGYRIIYLIAKDCVVEMETENIYTSNPDVYTKYFEMVRKPTYLDEIIKDFDIVLIEDLSTIFGKNK